MLFKTLCDNATENFVDAMSRCSPRRKCRHDPLLANVERFMATFNHPVAVQREDVSAVELSSSFVVRMIEPNTQGRSPGFWT